MFDTVLKNGQIFWEESLIKADMAIVNGKIAAIGQNLTGKNEVDIKGHWVLPGAIDAHTHFSLPFAGAVSADDFYSGSIAGAAGGVTTFIDFTAQQGEEGVLAGIERRRNQADPLVGIDYSLHACIGRLSPEVVKEIPLLKEKGITSLKIFMAYKQAGMMQEDSSILKILRLCRENDILVTVHAENGEVIDFLTAEAADKGQIGIEALPLTRPVFTEADAIRRIGQFAGFTGCKVYVVHVSSGEGAKAVSYSKSKGWPVAGETCPQYLYLDDSKLVAPDGILYSCCPPIRDVQQQQLLWKEVSRGTISVVATDHCPFTTVDKNSWNNDIRALPMGLPGIQTLPALVLNAVHSEKISLKSAVKLISENPAKIFGLYPQKGSLIPGTDADLMIYNPDTNCEIVINKLLMKTDYSPYEGLVVRGCVEKTYLRGKEVFNRNDGWSGQKGGGLFLHRNVSDPEFFKPICESL